MSDGMFLLFWGSLLPIERDISIADEMAEWSLRMQVPQTEFYKERPHLNRAIQELLGLAGPQPRGSKI